MLKYLFSKNTVKPFLILFILPLFHCHTVVYETQSSLLHSQLDASSFKTLTISRSKRDNDKPQNADVISQTPYPSVTDNNTATDDSVNNRTLQLIPSVKNGELNTSQSLPAWMDTIKSGALLRTGFVVLGFMSIIVIFFIVRGIRLRHKKSKSRKYGIITSTDMEMEPLDNDDDDEEDTTLFDAQHKYSLP